MRRFLARLLISVAPSVPPRLHSRVTTHTSVTGPRGEARPVAGSGQPEGGVLPVPRPPVTSHPELSFDYEPPRGLRGELNDIALAGAVAQWAEEGR